MRLVLALSSAAGLVAFWSGLSPGRSVYERRVEPYLNGLDGQPVDVHVGAPWLRRAVVGLARFLPAADRSLDRRLAEAGRTCGPEAFRQEQALWMLGGGLIGVALAAVNLDSHRLGLAAAPLTMLLACAAAYAAKDRALSAQIAKRRDRVAADLPVAIDLLTLSVMAGGSVQAALTRVSEALPGDTGDGFRACVADMRAGVSSIEALERLPSRLPGIAVARLADGLCTGIERGAPLAETLRAQCDDLRESRRRSLLEAGGKREILMLIPVVFLILPVVVVFALYPGLVALDLLVA